LIEDTSEQHMTTERIYEVSASVIAEATTRRIEREYHCSKPRPRNRAMGFAGTDRPRRLPWQDKERNERKS
jgi:hypothetical protein